MICKTCKIVWITITGVIICDSMHMKRTRFKVKSPRSCYVNATSRNRIHVPVSLYYCLVRPGLYNYFVLCSFICGSSSLSGDLPHERHRTVFWEISTCNGQRIVTHSLLYSEYVWLFYFLSFLHGILYTVQSWQTHSGPRTPFLETLLHCIFVPKLKLQKTWSLFSSFSFGKQHKMLFLMQVFQLILHSFVVAFFWKFVHRVYSFYSNDCPSCVHPTFPA